MIFSGISCISCFQMSSEGEIVMFLTSFLVSTQFHGYLFLIATLVYLNEKCCDLGNVLIDLMTDLVRVCKICMYQLCATGQV